MSYGIKGELIIIGGAEDKSGSREILRRVANMIDKEKDTMIVSTLASDLGREVGYDYKNLFHDYLRCHSAHLHRKLKGRNILCCFCRYLK